MPRPVFPDERALCETCGYLLRGLSSQGRCPECGEPVAASDPCHRTGPAWAVAMGPAPALATAVAVLTRPKRTFRQMRIDGPNHRPRLFLSGVALSAGGLGFLGEAILNGPRGLPLSGAAGAAAAVVALAYLEAAGVTYFSRRRGWRVPFALAERVACYASVGLILAVVLAVAVRGAWVWGLLDGPIRWIQSTGGLFGGTFGRAGVASGGIGLGLGVSVLGFEILTYLGVRQVRFANGPISPPAGSPS